TPPGARWRPTPSWPPDWSASPRRRGRSVTGGDTAPSATPLRVPVCSRTWCASWRETTEMGHQPCAVVGIGQTEHRSRRWDVSLGGLVREAATRALEDAAMDWSDIDAVVLGKAPDLF